MLVCAEASASSTSMAVPWASSSSSPAGMWKRRCASVSASRIGVVGRMSRLGAVQRIEPEVQLLAAFLQAERGVVGDVVAASHEGIDGAESLALAARQDEERVVEILRRRAGDAAAHGVRHHERARSGRPGGDGLAGCPRSSFCTLCGSNAAEELAHGSACDQSQFARLRDCWTISEHSVVLLLDGAQNFLTAAAEEIEIDGEFAINLSDRAAGPGGTSPARARLRTSSWRRRRACCWLRAMSSSVDIEEA